MSWKLPALVLYLAVLVVIGVIASRRMRSLRDYFVGGKRMGYWSVAFSARATGESAWLLLGLTGMGAAVGVQALWVVIGEVLGVAGAWLLLARRFKRLTDRFDSVTVPDYLESRFSDTRHHLRMVSAASLVVFVTLYVAAQIDATGKAFEVFLDWNWYLGALVGFCVVLVYVAFGGFVAVVWSDLFQGAMMVVGLVVLPVVGFAAAGGVGAVLDGLAAQDPVLLSFAGKEGWSAVGIASTLAFLCIGLGFMGSPQVFVRFMSLRDESEISRGATVAIAWTILADSGAVLIGMLARHSLGIEGETALPMLVEHLMPAMVVGLYIAIVLSASMSTVDSLLIVGASAAVRDWYQKVRRPDLDDAALVSRCRQATIAIASAALVVALLVATFTEERSIFWFVIFGWSGIAATFCPTVILSLFWSRFTKNGALAAMVTGFACVPLFKFGAPLLPGVGAFFAALEELPPAFALSALAGVFVSLLDKPPSEG
ncbi:MAG: sodium/proline symporter [Planctomycetota bacterium]|nr:sodium/proline symporter [Planctomycetota bacterium]